MTKFLKPATVEKIKADAGSEFVTVTFLKVNGEERTMNGQFNTGVHTVGGDAGAAASARNKAAGLIPLWVPAEARGQNGKAGWRSFKKDRVISIRAMGATITAN